MVALRYSCVANAAEPPVVIGVSSPHCISANPTTTQITHRPSSINSESGAKTLRYTSRRGPERCGPIRVQVPHNTR